MHEPLESIPLAQPNRQFPGGDVNYREIEQASMLYLQLTIGSTEEQVSRLDSMRITEIDHWLALHEQHETYNALKSLHIAWADTTPAPEAGSVVERIGTYTTLAFINRSHLLPTNFDDFSEQLETMCLYDYETIKTFADDAWLLMHWSHPQTYNILAPFVRHVATANELPVKDEPMQVLLKASSALPYLMAATTRMSGYLKTDLENIDGLSGGT